MSTAAMVLLLSLTGLLLLTAGAFIMRSVRTNDALHSCTAMMCVLTAGIPASVYGALGS
jgi:hypothetical protein